MTEWEAGKSFDAEEGGGKKLGLQSSSVWGLRGQLGTRV